MFVYSKDFNVFRRLSRWHKLKPTAYPTLLHKTSKKSNFSKFFVGKFTRGSGARSELSLCLQRAQLKAFWNAYYASLEVFLNCFLWELNPLQTHRWEAPRKEEQTNTTTAPRGAPTVCGSGCVYCVSKIAPHSLRSRVGRYFISTTKVFEVVWVAVWFICLFGGAWSVGWCSIW